MARRAKSVTAPSLGLHVTQYPSGRWGFVGHVPVELAYEPREPLSAHEWGAQLEIAMRCGPGFAKKIRWRSWETRDAALAAAKEIGALVQP